LKVEHKGKIIFEREGYLLYDSEKRYRKRKNARTATQRF
jgi:hypothetical protein